MGRNIENIVEVTTHDEYTEYKDLVTPFPPSVDDSDNGNILTVVDGEWKSAEPQNGVFLKIAEKEFEVSTESTSDIDVGEINCGEIAFTSDKLLFVSVRDKAGARPGYYYGSNSFLANPRVINETVSEDPVTAFSKQLIKYSLEETFTVGNYTTNTGVVPGSISPNGVMAIKARYGATSSTIINGTFKVEVYLVSLPSYIKLFEKPADTEQGDE